MDCLRITTGSGSLDDGFLSVRVESGFGFVEEVPLGYHAKGATVLDKCYVEVVSVQVSNTNDNAWLGSIQFSSDQGSTYNSMVCADCSDGRSTSHIAVDGNADATAATTCLNGKECKLEPNLKHCLKITTLSENNDDGYLSVKVDSGLGFVEEVTLSHHAKGATVLDKCYGEVMSVQVSNTNNDAWFGSIQFSVDRLSSYNPMVCADCSDGKTASRIAVDGNADATAATTCLNGKECKLEPAMCSCNSPGADRTGNQFTCTNGESRACASDDFCSATSPFFYGSWSYGCHRCVDFVPEGQPFWHDREGVEYDCGYYSGVISRGKRCEVWDSGSLVPGFGHTAREACCDCGGGVAAPTPAPTAAPMPTAAPTALPTPLPSVTPTASPTGAPSVAPTAAPTLPQTTAPTAMPTLAPSATPTSTPTAPTPTPATIATPTPTAPASASASGTANGLAPVAAAIGDPHMTNIRGERFDLFQPGRHVLVRIPKSASSLGFPRPLLLVEIDAEQKGGDCADVYIQNVNVTGQWVDSRTQGSGLHYTAKEIFGRPQAAGWQQFGSVELKVKQGHTGDGTSYLNFFVRKLAKAGLPVGGLLGEDDHTLAATPGRRCRATTALVATHGAIAPGTMASIAEASLH